MCPCSLIRRATLERDTVRSASRLWSEPDVARAEPPQQVARAPAGPPCGTSPCSNRACDRTRRNLLARELACQHQPLIARELARESHDAAQIVAQQARLLDVGACVGHFDPTARASRQGKRAGQRCLDRAAPAQRTAAIMDAREEFLLERIGDVGGVGEPLSAPGSSQQLERRLAVAVLEVLTPQPPAVAGKQELATRAGHERDRLAWIEQTKSRAHRARPGPR